MLCTRGFKLIIYLYLNHRGDAINREEGGSQIEFMPIGSQGNNFSRLLVIRLDGCKIIMVTRMSMLYNNGCHMLQ
jgi:hypothetical protein